MGVCFCTLRRFIYGIRSVKDALLGNYALLVTFSEIFHDTT
jgi:hypothetical protein